MPSMFYQFCLSVSKMVSSMLENPVLWQQHVTVCLQLTKTAAEKSYYYTNYRSKDNDLQTVLKISGIFQASLGWFHLRRNLKMLFAKINRLIDYLSSIKMNCQK